MARELYVKISDSEYSYGEYLISDSSVEDINKCSLHILKRQIIKLDGAFVYYFIKEIKLCDFYRRCFLRHWLWPLKIILTPTKYDLIDYKWNERVYYMVRERCELDHALSWLSTLGGAFSALGKENYFLTTNLKQYYFR